MTIDPLTGGIHDPQAWSMLWSRTVRGSIDLDADDPVAQALREHWAAQVPWLSGLRRVVDVGSGPAVLARHLRGATPGGELRKLHWYCLDGALLPASDEAEPGWHWLSQTDFATATPPEGPCDGVVSNFGLEYVPRADVAAACARWLLPAGRLSAVLHASGSVIDQTSRGTLDDIAMALGEVPLFERAADLLTVIATLPADPAARQRHGAQTRQAYNQAVDALKARMAERGQRCEVWIDMLTALTGLVQQALQGDVTASLVRCAELRQAYEAEVQRLRAMRASAIGATEQAALDAALMQAGFLRPAWRSIDSSVGRVAWHLSAERSA